MREAISGHRWPSVAIGVHQWQSQHESAHHVSRHGGRHRRREESLAAAHDQIQILQILLQLPVQMGGQVPRPKLAIQVPAQRAQQHERSRTLFGHPLRLGLREQYGEHVVRVHVRTSNRRGSRQLRVQLPAPRSEVPDEGGNQTAIRLRSDCNQPALSFALSFQHQAPTRFRCAW